MDQMSGAECPLHTLDRTEQPQPTPLEPMTFPLHGARLIEASAGTGKTFTIAGLYLRLLLGHGSAETRHRVPLTVDQILVVTFTEAATAELRDRIRARIHDARIAFARGQSSDPVIQPLLNEFDDHKQAAEILLQAERQMDEAAVYTIHGFCQRMLTQNAFESGSRFNNEFVTDESHLKAQVVADYWRRNFYPLPFTLAGEIRQLWSSPSALLSDISNYLTGAPLSLSVPAMKGSLADLHTENLKKIDELKAQWRESQDDFLTLISDSDINKRSYTKKSLPTWLEAVNAWAATETTGYDYPDKLEKFAQNVLLEKTPKGSAPQHAVFEAIETFLANPISLKAPLLAHAIEHCRVMLANAKNQKQWLSFDDLLTQLSASIDTDESELLLVRTGSEGRMIKQALADQGIASVYLSNRDSVFTSSVAQDLQRLLQAVLTPENDRALRASLASELFALDAASLDALNNDEVVWENAVNEFKEYRKLWVQRGVLPMLRAVISKRHIAERLLEEGASSQGENGERVLTDLMHIGELLQQASNELDSDHGLLRWLAQSISDAENGLGGSDDQIQRLESERNLVQIVTIHKSKGDLSAKELQNPIDRNWRITSYSGLVKQGSHHAEHDATIEITGFDIDSSEEQDEADLVEPERSIFTFPRGARPGTFLHSLFEEIEFTQPATTEENTQIILGLMESEQLDEEWLPILQQLIDTVLATPLDGKSLLLNQKAPSQRLVEMEFLLPIEVLSAPALNRVIQRHDPLSAKAGDLGFQTVQGHSQLV